GSSSPPPTTCSSSGAPEAPPPPPEPTVGHTLATALPRSPEQAAMEKPRRRLCATASQRGFCCRNRHRGISRIRVSAHSCPIGCVIYVDDGHFILRWIARRTL